MGFRLIGDASKVLLIKDNKEGCSLLYLPLIFNFKEQFSHFIQFSNAMSKQSFGMGCL